MKEVNVKGCTLILLTIILPLNATPTDYTSWFYNSLANMFSSATQNVKKEHVAIGVGAAAGLCGLYCAWNKYNSQQPQPDQDQKKKKEISGLIKSSAHPLTYNKSLIPYGIATESQDRKDAPKPMDDYVSVASLGDQFTIFLIADGHGGSFVARALAFGANKQEPLVTPITQYATNFAKENAPNAIVTPSLPQLIIDKLMSAPDIDTMLQKEGARLLKVESTQGRFADKASDAIAQLFKQAFKEADTTFTSDNMQDSQAGSTASIVLVDKKNNIAYVAYVGDSRVAIFNMQGQLKFATKDHDYYSQEEFARIENERFILGNLKYTLEQELKNNLSEKANDSHFMQKYNQAKQKYDHYDNAYNNMLKTKNDAKFDGSIRALYVSRDFGAKYKKEELPWLDAVPDVYSVALNATDYIVMASDGLWKIIDTENVSKFIPAYALNNKKAESENAIALSSDKAFQQSNNETLGHYARILQKEASEKLHGTRADDDVSVIVATP